MKNISIIVPVYNAEKYINKCIESLLNQTIDNYEIIIIDDKSTDNSLQIVKQYLKDNPKKIKLIENPENLGIGKTRNRGIKIATGKYIGFVDSDDYVDLNMFESIVKFANKNNLDIANSFYRKIVNDIEIKSEQQVHEISNVFESPNIINKIEYGPTTKIYKRTLISENNILFDEKLKYEDMPFVLKSFYYAKKVGHINNCFYNYRIHDNSETTTYDKKVFDMYEILKQVNKLYKEDIFEKELEYLNIKQITRYMLQQKKQEDKNTKNEFIEKGYEILNRDFPNWKNNCHYKKENKLKRIIKNNKLLLKLYVR